MQGGTMEVAKASGEIELRLFLWTETTKKKFRLNRILSAAGVKGGEAPASLVI